MEVVWLFFKTTAHTPINLDDVHLKEHWEQAKKEKVMSEVYYIIEDKHFRAKWELANSSQVNSYKQNVLWQNKKKTMRNVKKKKKKKVI